MAPVAPVRFRVVAKSTSRLAQLVERKTLNLVVVGSSPTVGVLPFFYFLFLFLTLVLVPVLLFGCRNLQDVFQSSFY